MTLHVNDMDTKLLLHDSSVSVKSLPHSVIAAGWIPFVVVTVLALIFSVLYVIWYRSDRPHHKAHGTSIIAVLGLFISLVTTILVPVDVFLVSYMKNSDGSWKPWAEDADVRKSLEDSILYAYYICYSIIFLFSFLIIPSNYFYHGLDVGLDEDDVEPSFGQKVCHSIKFTLLSVLVFTILILSGYFIPFHPPPPNITRTFLQEDGLDQNKAEDMMLFILNTLNIIGVGLLILYTGYGLSRLPCGLIRPTHGVRTRRTALEVEIDELERSIRVIEDRYPGGQTIPTYDRSQLERLEQQLRLLRREHRDLDNRARTLVSRCQLLLRPFEMVFGVVFSLFGFMIFLSLMLSNVDKAINSDGIFTGYTLNNSSLPNPADLMLVYSQQIFPLDYILYSLLVIFLLACTMSGITNVGIRCFCLSLYKIRAWRTPPRGLLLTILILMFIILAQNIVMLSLVPDYTMFGNQHYSINNTVLRCQAQNFLDDKDNCVPSRISVLMLSFHFKAWIFGAAYYWMIWVLLLSILSGSLFSIYHMRTPTRSAMDEADLLDSEDEDGNPHDDVPSNNPFD